MRIPASRFRCLVSAVALATVVGACATTSSGPPGTTIATVAPLGGTGAQLLDGVTLLEESAEQLDRVGLGGLDRIDPAGLTGMVATFEFGDGNWWGARVLLDSEGPYLLAPLYPADPAHGGTLQLYLSDGEHTSGPLELTVLPMSAAPGAFTAALDSIRAEAGDFAAARDTTWDALAGTPPAQVTDQLAALKLTQLLLDDERYASAATAYAALEPPDAALVDAIFAKIDLPGALDHNRFAAIAGSLPEQLAPSSVGESTTTEVLNGFRRSRRSGDAPAAGAACIPFYHEADGRVSAERLSEMMIGSAISDIAVNTSGLPGKTFAALEATLTLGSVLEAGASSGASQVFATVGKGAAAWKMFNAMRSGLLPSSFSDVTAELDPGDLEEDRPESMPGTWPSVRATAQSTGYSLDGDIAGAFADAFGGELIRTRLPKTETGEAVDWLGRLGDPVDLTDINNAGGAEPIKNAVNDLLPADGVITFCPQTFTAELGDGPWTWARPRQALLTVDNDALTYVNTTDIGRDQLAIGPIPSKFGQRSVYTDVPVTTHAIDVVIDPDVIYVSRPGESVPITATIEHAHTTKLGWYADRGEWAEGGSAAETDGSATLTLVTPISAEEFPDEGIRIEVESLSRTGLRAPDGDPPRYDVVYIKLAPFTISPDPGRVLIDGQLALHATDANGKPIEVEWSATGGSVTRGPSSAATYTAGKTPGTYTVTAWLPGHPDVRVTATVIVQPAECVIGNWELDVPAFVATMNQYAEGGESVTYLSGTSQVIVRDDGTATWLMNDVTMRMVGDGQAFTMVWNMVVDNNYSTDGTTWQGQGGSAAIDVFVVELGHSYTNTVPSALGEIVPYDCIPQTSLVIHGSGGALSLTYNGPP